MQIDGLDAFKKGLRALDKKIAGKVVRTSLRRGMKTIQVAVKAACPVDTGALKRSIVVRASKARRRGIISIEVRIGEGDFKGDTFYGAMIEYGTIRMPARPFIRPAFDRNEAAVARQVLDDIGAAIDEMGGK